MIVYAKKEGTVIWSDNDGTHKAGRVPLHESLVVLSESNISWYAIARPVNISLPVQPAYPDYWVKRGDVLTELPADGPEPSPEPEEEPVGSVTDEQAAAAIVTLLRWLKR